MGRQKILNLMVESIPKFKLVLFWGLKISEINVVEGSRTLIFKIKQSGSPGLLVLGLLDPKDKDTKPPPPPPTPKSVAVHHSTWHNINTNVNFVNATVEIWPHFLRRCHLIYIFVSLWRCAQTRVMAVSCLRFLDHTQGHTTVGRTPLDEWSARRRDLYLTTHNTHNRQTSIRPAGHETTISAGKRQQTYALDRAATGTAIYITRNNINQQILEF